MAQKPEDKNIKNLERIEKVQNPKIRTFNIRGIT
jgi:hypothetical protein